MFTMQMRVDNLDALRGRIGDDKILDSELRKGEKEALTAVRDEARRQASFSDMLPRAIRFEIDQSGTSGVVAPFTRDPAVGLSIEHGRHPGEAPSFEAVARWMMRKGIATGAAQRVNSRRRVRFAKGSDQARQLHDDSVRIALDIKARGTKPHPFMVPAAEAQKKNVTAIFREAVGRAIHKVARG